MEQADEEKNKNFFSEEAEIVEALSRDLLLLEQVQEAGQLDLGLINEILRSVHTLKGLAGMFGQRAMAELAHALEDLLEPLRLGRLDLGPQITAPPFEGVARMHGLLSGGEEGESMRVAEFKSLLRGIERRPRPQADPVVAGFRGVDPQLLSALTEFEQHRLGTCIEQGIPLYRLRVPLLLASLDHELDDLRQRLQPLAEVLTYLPRPRRAEEEELIVELLIASRSPIEALHAVLAWPRASLRAIERDDDEEERVHTLLPRAESRPPRRPSSRLPTQVRHAAEESENAYIQVEMTQLDALVDLTSELSFTRTLLARLAERLREGEDPRALSTALEHAGRSLERQITALQERVLQSRRLPLRTLLKELAADAQTLAKAQQKHVQVEIQVGELVVDVAIVEALRRPLMQLIRNAVDHGIASPGERRMQGKDATGRLRLRASQPGGEIVVEVSDDGAGDDEETLMFRALEKGLVDPAKGAMLEAQERRELAFLPGLSTRSEADELSGRGFGMDIVRTRVLALGGHVEIASTPGEGTRVVLALPSRLTPFRALLLRLGERHYALPISAVEEVLRLRPQEVQRLQGSAWIQASKGALPLCRLESILGLEREGELHALPPFAVVVREGERRIALLVDSLIGQRDIMAKPFGKSLSEVRAFSGAADLGEESLILVLRASYLVEMALPMQERFHSEVLR